MSEHSILDELKAPGAFGAGVGGALFGLRWLLTFVAGRFDRRQAALDAEHAALDKGWEGYREKLEGRLDRAEEKLATLTAQSAAMRTAFELVAGALKITDPGNSALARAETILASAFPVLPVTPGGLSGLLATIDTKDRARTAAARAQNGEEDGS